MPTFYIVKCNIINLCSYENIPHCAILTLNVIICIDIKYLIINYLGSSDNNNCN